MFPMRAFAARCLGSAHVLGSARCQAAAGNQLNRIYSPPGVPSTTLHRTPEKVSDRRVRGRTRASKTL